MSTAQSVLLVESDALLQSFVIEKLTEMGYAVDVAVDDEQARVFQQNGHYDLVLRDLPRPFSLAELEWRLKSRVSWRSPVKRLPASA